MRKREEMRLKNELITGSKERMVRRVGIGIGTIHSYNVPNSLTVSKSPAQVSRQFLLSPPQALYDVYTLITHNTLNILNFKDTFNFNEHSPHIILLTL